MKDVEIIVVFVRLRKLGPIKIYMKKANQIAHVLVDDLGLQSGNRVLIRSANNPMMVACWFAILKRAESLWLQCHYFVPKN